MSKGRCLGKDKHGYEYYSNQDGYVYQWRCDTCLGWLCSYAAWARTLQRVLIERMNDEQNDCTRLC